jgi:hypothetical protein
MSPETTAYFGRTLWSSRVMIAGYAMKYEIYDHSISKHYIGVE